MSGPARLAAFGAALVIVLGGAWAVGAAVGPTAVSVPAAAGPAAHTGSHDGAAVAAAETTELPGGLAASRGGYTLVPVAPTLLPGVPGEFAFRVTGADGAPVTAFDVEHDKQMHLIVVRRDGSAFQHVHPEMSPDGTWYVPLTLPAGGSYRAFADFAPAGSEGVTLGVDLAAPGTFEPVYHLPSRVADVDGYRVELIGELVAGQASPVTLAVSRDGQPVTDLQPYLAAYGHLVALRDGDLAYLHVHPDGGPGDGVTAAGPAVEFVAEVPSAGTYRLFLDFQHNGVVRTAEFTVPTFTAPAITEPTFPEPTFPEAAITDPAITDPAITEPPLGEPGQVPAAGVPEAGDHGHAPGEENHDR